MADQYGDTHRFFVQELMSVGILDSFQVKELYNDAQKICNVEFGDRGLGVFIKTIKNKLMPTGMDVKKWLDEDTWKKGKGKSTFYVLICTTERSSHEFPLVTKNAMHAFKEKDIEYIKLLMNRILMSENKEISRQDALNVTLQMGGSVKLSMSEAEASIEAFRAKMWLKFCPDEDYIRLTARFLAEMQSYMLNLRNAAEEAGDEDHPGHGVNTCKAPGCNHLVVRSRLCHKCNQHFHLYCVADPEGTGQDTHGKCPRCKEAIPLRNGGGGGGKHSGRRQSQSKERDSDRRQSSSKEHNSDRRQSNSDRRESQSKESNSDRRQSQSKERNSDRRQTSSKESVKRKRIATAMESSSSSEEED